MSHDYSEDQLIQKSAAEKVEEAMKHEQINS